jgi:cell wall-associated NlpC family hydrolase
VDWDAWQPGDLLYFAGTYRDGISHTGIYIGDGQFIHAENEGTGVVISSVYSDYYAGHYYGAYRHV